MSVERRIEQAVESTPYVEKPGHKLAHLEHDAILGGGELTRRAADALHGTWLGHPLHPVLTDIVIGSWFVGGGMDLIGELNDNDHARWAGDRLAEVGAAAAIPTALTGMTDFSAIPKKATKTGMLHGMMNAVALGLYAASIVQRRRGHRGSGLAFSFAGQLLVLGSSWLGGELVYKHKVGVDHADRFDGPDHWTAVLDEADLPQRTPTRAEVNGNPVMLYRDGDVIHAIGATCAHAGGPLHEGDVFHKHGTTCVQCPWHDSVFNLATGEVVHGPATRPMDRFDAQIRNGRVELRLSRRPNTGQSAQDRSPAQASA